MLIEVSDTLGRVLHAMNDYISTDDRLRLLRLGLGLLGSILALGRGLATTKHGQNRSTVFFHHTLLVLLERPALLVLEASWRLCGLTLQTRRGARRNSPARADTPFGPAHA